MKRLQLERIKEVLREITLMDLKIFYDESAGNVVFTDFSEAVTVPLDILLSGVGDSEKEKIIYYTFMESLMSYVYSSKPDQTTAKNIWRSIVTGEEVFVKVRYNYNYYINLKVFYDIYFIKDGEEEIRSLPVISFLLNYRK